MSVHIVDDEQRGDRPATPMRPSGSGGTGASAALGTRPLLILGRAPSAAGHILCPFLLARITQFSMCPGVFVCWCSEQIINHNRRDTETQRRPDEDLQRGASS